MASSEGKQGDRKEGKLLDSGPSVGLIAALTYAGVRQLASLLFQ